VGCSIQLVEFSPSNGISTVGGLSLLPPDGYCVGTLTNSFAHRHSAGLKKLSSASI